MNPTPSAAMILLIQPEGADAAAVRQALAADGGLRLQSVERLPTALARLAGGGVDAILLDLSLAGGEAGGLLDAFLKLRELASHIPIIVLISHGDEALALRAMRAGAADYLRVDQCAESLSQVVRAALDRSSKPDAPESQAADSRKTARIIAVLGVKGGVGATTVALNVAAELAQRHTVILAEMQLFFGTLLPYFKPHGTIRNLSSLLRVPMAELATNRCERACGATTPSPA